MEGMEFSGSWECLGENILTLKRNFAAVLKIHIFEYLLLNHPVDKLSEG